MSIQSIDAPRPRWRGLSLGWRQREGMRLRLALAIFILAFCAMPVARLVTAAFDGGLSAFWHVLDTPEVWKATGNTLQVAFGSGALALVIGVAFALILSVTTLRARTALAFIMVLSLMIAPQISALAFKTLAGPASPLLKLVGLAPAPGTPNPMLGAFGIMLVMGLHHAPLVAITLASGMASIPRSVIEAAFLEGASQWQVVRNILLPLLRPFMLTASLLVFVAGAKQFRHSGAAWPAGGLCHAADADLPETGELRAVNDWRCGVDFGSDRDDCRNRRDCCKPFAGAGAKPAGKRSPD